MTTSTPTPHAEGEGLLRRALTHEITFDDGSLCIGGAPILKVYRADDFPCRDEEKSDEEHDAEIASLAGLVARLAEGARQDGAAPDGTSWRVRAKEFAEVALGNAAEIGRLEAALSLRPPPAPEREGQSGAGCTDVTTCFICGKPLVPGQRVLDDVSGETGHLECFGPEREGYVKDIDTGEPLGPEDTLPTGYVWETEGHPAAAPPADPKAESAPSAAELARLRVQVEAQDGRKGVQRWSRLTPAEALSGH